MGKIVKDWTWGEIRGWLEGEGTIVGRVERRKYDDKIYEYPYIVAKIYQKDRRPLDNMCEWIRKKGKPCSVSYDRTNDMYVVELRHSKERSLPILKGLKHPAKREQLERAVKKTGLKVD
ncbi:MAG: hypothetical protein H3Z51_04665 [archaeon]|nr:hypothetical protein [archaeon]